MPIVRTGGASLRWRLSLIVSALLSVVVIAFGALAYEEVESALLRAGRARVEAVADQLSALMLQSARQRLDEARRLAALPEVGRLLRDRGGVARDAAAQAIRAAIGPQPSWIVIWAADGSRLLTVAPEMRQGQPDLTASLAFPQRPGTSELKRQGSVPYYDTVVSLDGADGYLAASRVITSAAAADLINRLIGSDARVMVGNRGNEIWTDLTTSVSKPPFDVRARAVHEYRASEGDRLAATAPVRDTPWAIAVEFPRASLLAPARAFLFRLAALAVPFVLIAALVTRWLMGRVVTPIQHLTQAAERIAGGDYTHRVRAEGRDEIARLGTAFNTMAATVEEGIHGLEARVRERTQELEAAVTALHSAQEEAVRREKLAMLGQLASGVGHELRNPLGVMTNAVYYLEMIQQDSDPEVREYLGILRGQIGLADRIVTDLLDFARIKPPQVREMPLVRIVDEQLQRLGPIEGIEVVKDFPPDLPPVAADPGQIGQVVLNLLTNAVQAMDGGGTLTLRGRLSREGLHLDVCDTGPGIPAELQEKIFEPLFTTKARGIGLGLAVSRSLTEANSGRLSVQSRVGEGTTFSLTLAAAGVAV